MSRVALYRKYRPTNFDEIFGQDHVRTILTNSLKESLFSHAYIFFGPRGVGKTSVARILAKGINCKDLKKGNPCNKCEACVSINEQRALDIIEIDAASNRGIDEIRDLREKVKFAPSELSHKVFIIDEVHMLTKEAFNALLKTLEEPPPHVTFILATTEIHKVPATVISRCQRFDFHRIPEDQLFKRLEEVAKTEKIDIDDNALKQIAGTVDGGLRDAISILDQISLNSDKGKKITKQHVFDLLGMIDGSLIAEIIDKIENKDKPGAINKIHEVLDRGGDVFQVTKAIMETFRKKLVLSLDSTQSDHHIRAIEILADSNFNFKHSLHPQLSLEIAVLKIIDLDRQPDLVDNVPSNQSEKAKVPLKTVKSSETVEMKVDPQKQSAVRPVKKDEQKAVKEIIVESEESIPFESEHRDSDSPEEKWSDILREIKKINNSIHAFVKEAEASFNNTTVTLTFPYKFHKERIEDPKNRTIVEGAINNICKGNFKIACVLDEEITPKKQAKKFNEQNNESAELNNISAFDILGGEILE